MIILSQDKETIVNFENVTKIIIISYAIGASIKAHFEDGTVELGDYKDEERAKEVLKDIIKAINGENFVECNESTLNIHSIEQKVFYMPKEWGN